MEILEKELYAYDSKKFLITHLHPTLLSLNADLWICNLYSTTCCDAFYLNVPTIEFTDYNEKIILNFGYESLGKEMIDIFIDIKQTNQHNQILLNKINELMSSKKIKKPIVYSKDINFLINKLTN